MAIVHPHTEHERYPIQPASSVLPADYEAKPRRPEAYHPGTGADRYVRFLRDWCGTTLSPGQEEILTTVEQEKYVHIEGANGFGKSYAVAGLALAFLYCNPHTTVNATSGGYATLDDTLWKPMKTMFKAAKEKGLPGRTVDSPPILYTELHDEWYFRAIAPRDPRDLEGRHNDHMLSIVEEADKPYISDEHINSADSTVTDEHDRMVVLCNPPEDEVNCVYELAQSDLWTTVRFSSFDSQNVQADLGLTDRPKIPGLIELSKIKETWQEWNNEEWPGETDREAVAQIIRWSFPEYEAFRDDLSGRWYRRRAGIMPQSNASIHRPIYPEWIEDAYQPRAAPPLAGRIPTAAALDVARDGGDWNVFSILLDGVIVTEKRWRGVDHVENEAIVREYTDDWPQHVPLCVDAQGEGSGLADRLMQAHPSTVRFNAGAVARKQQKYDRCWDEGLDNFGQFIKRGGTFEHKHLREEALAVARTVSYDETYIGARDAEVLDATSKDDVKERLGRSPDIFDAAYMAVWVAENGASSQRLTW